MKICGAVVILLFIGVCLCLCACSSFEYKGISSLDKPFYSLSLVGSGTHNSSSFTEGFFWSGNKLCESTGLVGESHFYKDIDYTTGVAKETIDLPAGVFGEGSVVLDDVLYVLTYKNKIAYTYDFNTLSLIDELAYPREGWGLTTDGEWLYASDGSSNIFVMDKNLSTRGVIAVTEHGAPVEYINELEYIDGYIWANVWLTDDVVVIDAVTGNVIQRIHLSDVLPASALQYKQTKDDVLNGLAYNAATDTLFVTGKRMPEIYELSFDR